MRGPAVDRTAVTKRVRSRDMATQRGSTVSTTPMTPPFAVGVPKARPLPLKGTIARRIGDFPCC